MMKKADENDSIFWREINGDGDGKIGLRKLISKFYKNLGMRTPF